MPPVTRVIAVDCDERRGSYHQGSAWPLFTGWVALAEYRARRVLSGYQHLMQNADLTWFEDPGAVTELLSGAFFQSLGRSTPQSGLPRWCLLLPCAGCSAGIGTRFTTRY